MSIKSLKIRTKLFSAFGIMILLIVSMAVITGGILTEIKNTAQQVETENLPYALLAEEMTLAAVQVQQWLTDVSATHNRDGYKDAEEAAEKFQAASKNSTKCIPVKTKQLH